MVPALLLLLLAVHGSSAAGVTLLFNYATDSSDARSRIAQGSLAVRGSACGLNWNSGIVATQVSDTQWQLLANCSASDTGSTLLFKALVNDQDWQVGANSAVEIDGQEASVQTYPYFYTQQGVWGFLSHDFASPQLNNTRPVSYYAPPGFVENSLRPAANVLVMQDGQNLYDPSTSATGVAWMVQTTIDEQIVEGNMDDVFIISPWNTGANRINEYTYSYNATYGGGEGDLYLDFIEQTVVPAFAQKFPRLANPGSMGILGSSLGGLISCYAVVTRASIYQKAGCMSSSFWWNNEDFIGTVMPAHPSSPSQNVDIYLDSGTCCPEPDGDDRLQTVAVREQFKTDGFTMEENLWYFLDQGGAHSEGYWGARFKYPMTGLYPVPTLSAQTRMPRK